MAYTTIDDPSEYFTTTLYVGNATARSITNDANAGDFQPDWLWVKVRNNGNNNRWFDSSRGVNLDFVSNLTQADSDSSDRCTAFNSNGFSIGDNGEVNSNTHNIVAWQWKCNAGTTATNDASSTGVGSIDSVIQANTTAGFSMVTYTGNGTEGASWAHGLGVAPDLVIVKGRTNTDNWAVFNGTSTTTSRSLHLETTQAEIPVSSYNFWNLYWDETRPSSTVVTLGVDAKVNGNNINFMAYCFASIPGYSKIGKYVGNGNAEGAYIPTGFKPAWVLAKRTDSANSWVILDNKRNTSNAVTNYLQPNAADVEGTSGLDIDFLSNGFKWRTTSAAVNANNGRYLYYAIAENPFVSSTGTPTTAR